MQMEENITSGLREREEGERERRERACFKKVWEWLLSFTKRYACITLKNPN